MIIPGNEIHIYRSSLESSSELLKQYESLLSPDEFQKAYRYKFEKDRDHFITGRAFLRNILAKYLNQSPDKIIFSYSDKGKPFIRHSNLKFNLAHSEGKAVFAFAEKAEVGIDIEYMRELPDALQIAKRFFSEEEVNEILKVRDDEIRSAFFNCWTRKEAFIKAVDEGLSYPLKDFTVTLIPGVNPEIKWIKDKVDEVKEWKLVNIQTDENYISSLAVKAAEVILIYK